MMGGICARFAKRIQELDEKHHVDILKVLRKRQCPIFWMLGGPCSGKSTICARLARLYHFYHIDLDQLLREELTKSSERERLHEEEGELRFLPREFIIGIIQREVLAQCFFCRGILIEGYPRTVSQAAELVREVGPPSYVFYFHASLHNMKKRLRHERPLLAKAGLEDEATYIKIYTFYKFFYPLLLKYKEKTIRIDTDGDIDKMFEDLEDIFNGFLKEKKIEIPRSNLE